jgi:hypothetical protein
MKRTSPARKRVRVAGIVLLGCSLGASPVTLAQQADAVIDRYLESLGTLRGAISSIKDMYEICAEAFPERRTPNLQAYLGWRKDRQAFLREIDRHQATVLWAMAGQDERRYAAWQTTIEGMFAATRQAIERGLTANGHEVFARACAAYPDYLKSPRADLETHYVVQVRAIREIANLTSNQD